MSRRLERGTDLWQSLSDIRGAIHVLYPKNIDKLSQWQSHNLGPQVSERDQLGVAWFIDTEINNTSAINFLGASNTNGRVEPSIISFPGSTQIPAENSIGVKQIARNVIKRL
jgi:hypothetical protein